MGSSTIQWALRPVVKYHLRRGVGLIKFLKMVLDPSPPPLYRAHTPPYRTHTPPYPTPVRTQQHTSVWVTSISAPLSMSFTTTSLCIHMHTHTHYVIDVVTVLFEDAQVYIHTQPSYYSHSVVAVLEDVYVYTYMYISALFYELHTISLYVYTHPTALLFTQDIVWNYIRVHIYVYQRFLCTSPRHLSVYRHNTHHGCIHIHTHTSSY